MAHEPVSLDDSLASCDRPLPVWRTILRLRWMIIYVEKALQLFILTAITFGWYLCTFHVGIDWLIHRKGYKIFGVIYVLSVNLLITSVTGIYLYLTSGRYTHNVASYPLPEKTLLTDPYECVNGAGDLASCVKGNCTGKWKPPRTHHCSICGVCRLEFDHHCPWIGACVTLSNMKAFLFMLFIVPVATSVAVGPIFMTLLSHLRLALDTSQNDAWATRIWWNWTGSWIVCSGPLGRWPVATILGFLVIGSKRHRDREILPGYLIEEPHLRVFAIAMFALLLSCFSMILAFGSLRRIIRGTVTLETLRPGGKSTNLICIPQGIARRTVIAPVLTGERIYDLEPANNWRLFIAKPLIAAPATRSVMDYVSWVAGNT